jgi:membrane protein DedA with SNARE-associated domain
MFAYLGALCWVITFLTLGYFFGAQWQAILQVIDRDLLIIVLAVSVVGLLYFVTHKK